MSADTRSVATDALATLGTIIDENQKRDAIHVAVEPVQAACTLRAGEHVGKDTFGTYGPVGNPLGIVDPFLKEIVREGEWFWLLVYPRHITSLRHVWSHPAFEEAIPETISREDHVVKSKAWIDQHAQELDLTTKGLMEYAQIWLNSEEHTIQQGSEHWRDTFNPMEFWHHYEIVTGTIVSRDLKQSFFCCTC